MLLEGVLFRFFLLDGKDLLLRVLWILSVVGEVIGRIFWRIKLSELFLLPIGAFNRN